MEEQPELDGLPGPSVLDDAIAELVDSARQDHSDSSGIEIKSGLGGLPDSLTATLSAFANRPGGGVIILGLSEEQGFSSVSLPEPAMLARALVERARKALEPAVTPEVELVHFEGSVLVVARVAELPVAAKPCFVRRTGLAYVRGFDGDHSISDQEQEVFRSDRGQPAFDRQPIDGSSSDDLDPVLTSLFLSEVRSQPSSLAAMTDEEILFHKNVVAPDRARLTLAGLYALGSYPQRLLPSLQITASAAPLEPADSSTRSRDVAYISGSLPDMLDASLPWIRRNTSSRVVFDEEGHGRSVAQYPNEAVRELVANALVHRDLGPHVQSVSVNLRLENNRLVLTNPGGLWGITVEQLGRVGGGVSRNPALYEICKFVRTRSGARVIEGIGSGIVAVRRSLLNAGMTPPKFIDNGVRFSVLVPRHTLLDPADLHWLSDLSGSSDLTDSQKHALVVMRRGGTWTNHRYRTEFALDSVEARRELGGLVQAGLAIADGDGRGRVYRIKPADPVRPTEAPASARAKGATRHGASVLKALADGPATVAGLEGSTKLSRRQISYALERLRQSGHVVLDGAPGKKNSLYRLATRKPG